MTVTAVIVDHRATTREVLRQLFEEVWGWSVLGQASDSTEALALVRSTSPDVVVVDSHPADPVLASLSELVAPLGRPVVVSLLDFPHEHAATRGPAVLKGVPVDHIRQVILEALEEARPGGAGWSAPAPEALVPTQPLPGPTPEEPVVAPPDPEMAPPGPDPGTSPEQGADTVVWSDEAMLEWTAGTSSDLRWSVSAQRPSLEPPSWVPTEAGMSVLVGDLTSSEPAVRLRALELVRSLPPGQAGDWLARRAAAGDPSVPSAGAALLGHGAGAADLDRLAEALLEMPEGRGRSALEELLGRLPGTPGLLRRWLESPDVEARLAGVRLGRAVGVLPPEVLALALADASPRVRRTGLANLPQPLDESSVTALLAVISGGAPAAAEEAARALDESSGPHPPAAAEACLSHRSASVRQVGVSLLARVEGSSQRLAELVLEADPVVSSAAAEALASFPPTEVLVGLWPRLTEAASHTRRRVIGLLQGVDRQALERLARASLSSAEPARRAVGIETFVQVFGDRSTQEVNRALVDPSPEVRLAACRALLEHPEAVSMADVGARLQDPDGQVRRLAAEVLVAADDERAAPFLLDAARDQVPEVARPARQFLQARASGPSAASLVAALGEPSRRAVATELLVAAAPAGLDLVVAGLDQVDPPTRAARLRVLRAAPAVESLRAWLAEPDPARRRMALRALASSGAGDGRWAALESLGDPEAGIRREACGLLGLLGGSDVAAVLQRVLATDPDLEVVAAAEAALRRLGQIEPGP